MQSSEAVQSTQQQQTAQSITYPEELEKAWTALRNFWLDIIKEVEIEQEIIKQHLKDHDNNKKS